MTMFDMVMEAAALELDDEDIVEIYDLEFEETERK